MYLKGERTGSNKANRQLAEGSFKKIKTLSREEEELLFDPQTSGGLLLSVPSAEANQVATELKNAGIDTTVQVGEVVSTQEPLVRIF
jgi:selenide,water dikinase